MPLESDCRSQDAVLLEADASNNDGEATTEAAAELKVRWEDGQGQIQDGQGDVVTYDATVIVGQDIPMDSVLYLGTEDARTDDTDPEYYRVVATKSIPDVKGRNFRRTVFLARQSGTAPALT